MLINSIILQNNDWSVTQARQHVMLRHVAQINFGHETCVSLISSAIVGVHATEILMKKKNLSDSSMI